MPVEARRACGRAAGRLGLQRRAQRTRVRALQLAQRQLQQPQPGEWQRGDTGWLGVRAAAAAGALVTHPRALPSRHRSPPLVLLARHGPQLRLQLRLVLGGQLQVLGPHPHAARVGQDSSGRVEAGTSRQQERRSEVLASELLRPPAAAGQGPACSTPSCLALLRGVAAHLECSP